MLPKCSNSPHKRRAPDGCQGLRGGLMVEGHRQAKVG